MREAQGMKLMLDTGFWRHPKLRALASALGVDTSHAGAVIIRLWCETMMYAEDGELGSIDHGIIADWCDWPRKDVGRLISALTTPAGPWQPWVDLGPPMRIHEWRIHQGRIISERARQRRIRRTEDPTEDVQSTPCAVDGLIQTAAFCASPGYGAKRRAFEDLLRRGFDDGTITAHFSDPAKRSLGFYEIIRAIEATRTAPINGEAIGLEVLRKMNKENAERNARLKAEHDAQRKAQA